MARPGHSHAITIEHGFWAQRRDVNVNKSIPSVEKLLEANGRMDNVRRLIGKNTAAQRGPVYSDFDVYKWTEAAAFALQSGDRPELCAAVEKISQDLIAAQHEAHDHPQNSPMHQVQVVTDFSYSTHSVRTEEFAKQRFGMREDEDHQAQAGKLHRRLRESRRQDIRVRDAVVGKIQEHRPQGCKDMRKMPRRGRRRPKRTDEIL